MVTESGEVPVPRGARWAAVTTVGSAHFEGRSEDEARTVLNVSDKESIRVDLGEVGAGKRQSASPGVAPEGDMVLIEWLFDADDTGSH